MDLNIVKQWLDLGWPTLLLVLMAYGIRRAFVWAKPLGEAVAYAHIEQVKKVGETQQQIVSAVSKIADTQQQQTSLMTSLECNKRIVPIHEQLVNIRNRLEGRAPGTT